MNDVMKGKIWWVRFPSQRDFLIKLQMNKSNTQLKKFNVQQKVINVLLHPSTSWPNQEIEIENPIYNSSRWMHCKNLGGDM